MSGEHRPKLTPPGESTGGAFFETQNDGSHTVGRIGVSPTGLERMRGPGRRLSESLKSAEEGQLTKEQFLFVVAVDAFKKSNNVQFPSWTDVMEIVRLLGYRKTCHSELNLTNAEDWIESGEGRSNVRPQRWAERFLKKAA